jgi:transposase
MMVVELHRSGKSSREVGQDPEIPSDIIRRWSPEYIASRQVSFNINGNASLTPELWEIANFKKALKETQLLRDILKKAVSIFFRSVSKYSDS